jgi:hypothetical protein
MRTALASEVTAVNEVKFEILDRLQGRAFIRAPVIEEISNHFQVGASFFVEGTEEEIK